MFTLILALINAKYNENYQLLLLFLATLFIDLAIIDTIRSIWSSNEENGE